MYEAAKLRFAERARGLARTVVLMLGAGLAAAATSTSADAYEYPELNLKFGHPYNDSHPLGRGARRFADLVRQRSGGKITVTVFPNATLGSARDLLDSMRINVVDIALVPAAHVAGLYPRLRVFSLPFIFRDRHHAYAMCDGEIGQGLFEDMRRKIGIRSLAMFESGFRTITTRSKKIETPDDMKGVKFRVANEPILIATFRALGTVPTIMPMSEVFTALQTGVADGQDNPVGNVWAFGWYKVQHYITLSHHLWAGIMLLINDRKFEGWPEEVRDLLSTTARETQDWEREELHRLETRYLSEMEAAGMTVTHLTPEQFAAFREKLTPVQDQYREEVGADLIESVVNLK